MREKLIVGQFYLSVCKQTTKISPVLHSLSFLDPDQVQCMPLSTLKALSHDIRTIFYIARAPLLPRPID